MKKLLIGTVVLAGAAAAASPYFFGSQIEKVVQERATWMNKQIEASVKANPQIEDAKVTVKSYKKGYMNAKSKWILHLALNLPGESAPVVYDIPVNMDITHGPYLGDAGFGMAKWVARPDLSGLETPEFIKNDTFTSESVIGFAGNMDQQLVVAPIKHKQDGTTVNFAGATLTSQSSLSNSLTFTGKMDVQQLSVSNEGDEEQFILKPFTMDIEGEGDDKQMKGSYDAKSSKIEATFGDEANVIVQSMGLKGTYEKAKGFDSFIGDTEILLQNITFSGKEVSPEPVKLPELKFVSTVKQPDDKHIDITAKYAAKLDPSLMAALESPINVKAADLEIQFKGLPTEIVKKYQQFIQQVSSEEDLSTLDQEMQDELPVVARMLVNSGFATRVELHAKSDEGGLNADIDLGFKPGLNMSEQDLMELAAMPNPQKVLSMLVGRGHADLNKSVTDKMGVTPMLQMMAADFVSLEGDTFKSDVQIKDGQLLVNGTPLPISAPPSK
ncbi:MAG: hypothetical protein CSB47_10115 [Proteobacteria bacterium]|nr:MAG: hypothetical protein CSB47_10115 [Pseudomonadota bacterium]